MCSQSMERATNRLQLQIHRSFSSYSPFVDRPLTSRKSKAFLLKNSANNDISYSSACATPAPQPLRSSHPVSSTNKGNFSFPTVLELTQLSKGAMKSTLQPGCKVVKTKDDSSGDGEETKDEQVRQKLLHATCLKASRELGLDNSVTNLRMFLDSGGTHRIAIELVRHLSTSYISHDERSSAIQRIMKPFCEAFMVDFDKSLLQYVKNLCASKAATQESIVEAASGEYYCGRCRMRKRTLVGN
jgi:hypothetical protein